MWAWICGNIPASVSWYKSMANVSHYAWLVECLACVTHLQRWLNWTRSKNPEFYSFLAIGKAPVEVMKGLKSCSLQLIAVAKSSLLDNMFQDLKAKMSDDGNLCYFSQPQATRDTDRALFFKLFTKLKEEKLLFPQGNMRKWISRKFQP